MSDPETAADYQRVGELSEELGELARESDRLLAQWTELSEQIEAEA